MTRKTVIAATNQESLFRYSDSQSNTVETKAPLPKILSHAPWVKRRAPLPTEVFEIYWYFAAERQHIYRKRIADLQMPWSKDPILNTYKFTNVFRAADRTSQYLIRHIIYDGAYSLCDTVFRVLLFKLFNKIETWELLSGHFGDIRFDGFNWQECDEILTRTIASKCPIYSAAYIMPSGSTLKGSGSKHRSHLHLLRTMMDDHLPAKLNGARSMREGYDLLLSYPTIGPFLAYQFITDINYSTYTDFDEMEFVVPGPGARDGIRKCFRDLGDYSEAQIIRAVAESQTSAFEERGLTACTLFGRPLQLIDCQNLFCEVDKYARVAYPNISGRTKRTRIKQKYYSTTDLPTPWFPPKWNINENIAKSLGSPS